MCVGCFDIQQRKCIQRGIANCMDNLDYLGKRKLFIANLPRLAENAILNFYHMFCSNPWLLCRWSKRGPSSSSRMALRMRIELLPASVT